MKKLICTVVVAFFATGVFAQGISGGLKAGVNFANQTWESGGISISPDARTGFHAGAYLNIGFSDKLSVQPELLFSATGATINDADIKTNYVSIPVMIKYNVASIVNLHVGAQFGMLLSAKDEDDNDIKDGYKGMDLGLGIGAGLDLPMGLNVTARYVLGLSNIAEEDPNFSDVTVKSKVFQLSLGYRLFGGD